MKQGFLVRFLLLQYYQGLENKKVSYAQNGNDSFIAIFTTGKTLQEVKSYAVFRTETFLLYHVLFSFLKSCTTLNQRLN